MELSDNDNLSSLGYELERTDDGKGVRRLLDVCGLDLIDDELPKALESTYLVAATPAGGVAAAVGLARYSGRDAVVHSLAVAPSSRGIGIGASLLASTMLYLREECDVESIYIDVDEGLSGYFRRFGFIDVDDDELPSAVAGHPSFVDGGEIPLVRRYGVERHGLDQCAFCLMHNTTEDATLPVGSVFWFRQSGPVLEAQYRGGPVRRGQLLGAMDGEALRFLWQSCTGDGDLMRGDGEIIIEPLDDGRREMRETLGEDPGELLLREL